MKMTAVFSPPRFAVTIVVSKNRERGVFESITGP